MIDLPISFGKFKALLFYREWITSLWTRAELFVQSTLTSWVSNNLDNFSIFDPK